jgi:hypothetical protein
MRPKCVKYIARWLVRVEVLEQFWVAVEVTGERVEDY